MDDIGVVQIVDGFADLVDDILLVPVLENVAADEGMQVDVHVLKDQVDINVVTGAEDLLQPNNIRVFELLQKHDLAVDALSISRVGESIEIFLQCF